MLRPLALVTALAISLGLACWGGDAAVTLTGSDGASVKLSVELAETAAERSRGLMFREELPEDRGMLFVFPSDALVSFWMKDTSIPLSIAFISAEGVILDIQDMEPFSMEQHRPRRAFRYALEVNQGWFREHGLGRGDRVEIPDSVSGARAGE